MLTHCSRCNSDAVMPKSGLCLTCGYIAKMNAQGNLARCSYCDSDAVMPRSGLCLVCGNIAKIHIQAPPAPEEEGNKTPENELQASDNGLESPSAETPATCLDAGDEPQQDTPLITVTVDADNYQPEAPSVEEPVTDFDINNKPQKDVLLALGMSAQSDLKRLKDIMESFYNNHQTSLNNHRVATRFIREDIVASINIESLFGFGKTIPVDLMDITSKGVLISTDRILGIDKKIRLTLQFKTGKVFVINAMIVRHANPSHNEYGIKFNRYNNELGDYLLETQDQLIFK